MVPMVGSSLRRRAVGPGVQKLERPGNISQGLSSCSGSGPRAGRLKHQVDVSHQQLSLSIRKLELRARLLSGIESGRLARPNFLRAEIQERAKPGYSVACRLAI